MDVMLQYHDRLNKFLTRPLQSSNSTHLACNKKKNEKIRKKKNEQLSYARAQHKQRARARPPESDGAFRGCCSSTGAGAAHQARR